MHLKPNPQERPVRPFLFFLIPSLQIEGPFWKATKVDLQFHQLTASFGLAQGRLPSQQLFFR
jgi:hypothetical protein